MVWRLTPMLAPMSRRLFRSPWYSWTSFSRGSADFAARMPMAWAGRGDAVADCSQVRDGVPARSGRRRG